MCPECAKKVMGQDVFSGFSWDFPDLFQSMFSFAAPQGLTAGKSGRCDTCGCTFDDIVSSGRAGCPDCYQVFFDRILPSVERIHGKVSHVGKIPVQEVKEPTREQKIAQLEAQLQQAIGEQEFEQAAKLRDQIKELRNQQGEA